MKKLITLCLLIFCAAGLQAQYFSFQPTEDSYLELYSEPIVGLNDLYIGDEGYITFSVVNTGDRVYRGPIYIRIFEREHSHLILARDNVKMYPGRVYEITTVFPTDRLAPFVRYFIGFEYIDKEHFVHINNYRGRTIPNFTMVSPIINRAARKAPVRPRIQQFKSDRAPEPGKYSNRVTNRIESATANDKNYNKNTQSQSRRESQVQKQSTTNSSDRNSTSRRGTNQTGTITNRSNTNTNTNTNTNRSNTNTNSTRSSARTR